VSGNKACRRSLRNARANPGRGQFGRSGDCLWRRPVYEDAGGTSVGQQVPVAPVLRSRTNDGIVAAERHGDAKLGGCLGIGRPQLGGSADVQEPFSEPIIGDEEGESVSFYVWDLDLPCLFVDISAESVARPSHSSGSWPVAESDGYSAFPVAS
jgi:hypothetical protein